MSHELTFIPEKLDNNNKWIEANEFLWKIPVEEMAVLYASCCIRLEALTEAEANLKNYRHQEPLKINGKTKIVEIHNGVPFLKNPFFKNHLGETSSPECLKTAQELFANTNQWRTSREVGLQAIASIGWILDITKARPPDITKDTSSTDYEAKLLPQNLKIKEEATPSGYNKQQLGILKKTQAITVETLQNCEIKKDEIKELGAVAFGNLVFKTYSRIWSNLPDPEEIERQRFERMREQAKAKREEEDN